MVEQRTTIRQRLDLAQMVLADDRTYRHALQYHHYTLSVMDHLSTVTRCKAPKRSAQLLSSTGLLYSAEYRDGDVPMNMGGSADGVPAHFLQYALSKLPEAGRFVMPLRDLIEAALRLWEQRNPGVVAVPGLGRRAGQTV